MEKILKYIEQSKYIEYSLKEWQKWLNNFMLEATEKFGFEVLDYDT